jgi:hypothetical protein
VVTVHHHSNENALAKLLTAAWAHDPAKRPTFLDLITMIEELLIDAAITDASGRKLWNNFWFRVSHFTDM